MNTDKLGIPYFTEQDLVNEIYKGNVNKILDALCSSKETVEKFNNAAERFGNPGLREYQPLAISQEDFDSTLQAEWFMPEDYKSINVYEYLLNKCTTNAEVERMRLEMDEYENRGMTNVLRYMIYLVDFMRDNKIVWGVGRGSSVASFVLYLIGIHRINSIQYGLDFSEFMR